DAWAMAHAQTDNERQEVLNRNKVFVSGVDFGLNLTDRDPLNVQALPRSIPARPDATSTARSSVLSSRSSLLKPAVTVVPDASLAAEPVPASKPALTQPVAASDADPPKRIRTQKDADYLEDRYKPQLAALAKEGAEKYHFVSYAPPAFLIFHNRIALQ